MATQHSSDPKTSQGHEDTGHASRRSNGDFVADNVNYLRNYSIKLGEYTLDMATAGLDGIRTTINACGSDGKNDCISGYGFVDAVIKGQKKFFDEMSGYSDTLLQRLSKERDVYYSRREPVEKIDYDRLATLVAEKLENIRKAHNKQGS
jgi:hypothetical protein